MCLAADEYVGGLLSATSTDVDDRAAACWYVGGLSSVISIPNVGDFDGVEESIRARFENTGEAVSM